MSLPELLAVAAVTFTAAAVVVDRAGGWRERGVTQAEARAVAALAARYRLVHCDNLPVDPANPMAVTMMLSELGEGSHISNPSAWAVSYDAQLRFVRLHRSVTHAWEKQTLLQLPGYVDPGDENTVVVRQVPVKAQRSHYGRLAYQQARDRGLCGGL